MIAFIEGKGFLQPAGSFLEMIGLEMVAPQVPAAPVVDPVFADQLFQSFQRPGDVHGFLADKDDPLQALFFQRLVFPHPLVHSDRLLGLAGADIMAFKFLVGEVIIGEEVDHSPPGFDRRVAETAGLLGPGQMFEETAVVGELGEPG